MRSKDLLLFGFFDYFAKIRIMEETTKQWGGKREGAGRKKTVGGVKNLGLRVPQDILDILDKVDKRSEFIFTAVREKAERDGLV